MKKTILLNASDGCSQTIKSQYSNTSLANMFHKGAYGATGIMEIYDEEDTILHLPREKDL